MTFENDHKVYYYRDKLQANYRQNDFSLEVGCDDIQTFDPSLFELLRQNPTEYLPRFEAAAGEVVARSLRLSPAEANKMHKIQIQLFNYPVITELRNLDAQHVSTLVTVRGIVVQASRAQVKPTKLSIMCRNCKLIKTMENKNPDFGGTQLPAFCDTPHVADSGLARCPRDPFRVLGDSSVYIDSQRLKLQEHHENIPQGQMPRHLVLACRENLVHLVKPGSRLTVVGIYNIVGHSKGARERQRSDVKDVGIRVPYLRVVGMRADSQATSRVFSLADEADMVEMSKEPQLRDKLASSIAPSMFGHEDIKRGIACMLFGGARKQLPDGMRLRGDINVLLMGDPSVCSLRFAPTADPLYSPPIECPCRRWASRSS